MKKIFVGLLFFVLLFNAIAFGAPQPADEFQKTSGFPNNLPSGWSFTKESDRGYKIYIPDSSDSLVGIAMVPDKEMQGLTPEQAREKFLSAMKLPKQQSSTFTKFKSTYGTAKSAGICLYGMDYTQGPFTDMEFIVHDKKLYVVLVSHPTNKVEVEKNRKTLLNTIF